MLGLRIHEVEQIHGKQVRDHCYFIIHYVLLHIAVDIPNVSLTVLTGTADHSSGGHLNDIHAIRLR